MRKHSRKTGKWAEEALGKTGKWAEEALGKLDWGENGRRKPLENWKMGGGSPWKTGI